MKEKGLGVKWKQIVGVPRDGEISWSQVRLEVRQKGKIRVGLIVMLSLESQEEVMEKGRKIMEEIVESFEISNEVGMSFVTKEVIMMKEELQGIGEGLIGLILADEDNRRSLYVGGVGGLRIELIRNGGENEIWRGGQPVSGWLQANDKIVVGTRDFFEKVWSSEDEIGEIRTKVGELENGGKVVGLVIEVGAVEKVVEMEELLLPEVETAGEETVEVVTAGDKWTNRFTQKTTSNQWLTKLKRKWGFAGGLTLKPENVGRKSWGLVVGVIFLMVLLGSVVVGARKQAVDREREEFLAVVEPIEYTLEEVERIKAINGMRARSLVLEAREEVKKQGNRFETGREAEDWKTILVKIDSAWQEVSGEVQMSGEKWLDLGVIKSGIDIDGVDTGKKLLVWGEDERVIIEVDLGDKSAEVIVGGEIMEGVKDIAAIKSGEILLTEEMVKVVDPEGKELQSLDLEGVKGKLIKGFGNNIYVVADEDLFRFAATENEWGKRQRFLLAGSEIDTSRVVDIAIDGDIWLLSDNGELVRLSQGKVVDYSLKPVEDFVEPLRIMASEELNRVWVWDKKLGVIEFERETGNYLRKMIWGEFEQMSEMVLDEENKRLMGVKGSEVWTIGL